MALAEGPLVEALARLTLREVWELAPEAKGPPPARDGCVCSPLRPDRHPSFSVFAQGRRFEDKARPEEASGGVWDFVRLARPDWPPAECARWLIRRAGLDPDAKPLSPARSAARGREVARRGVYARRDEAKARKLATDADGDGVAASRPGGGARGDFAVMPKAVADRWQEGVEFLAGSARARAKIAAARGWPASWVEFLVESGSLSGPWQPWCDAGDVRAERGKAFAVLRPRLDPQDAGAVKDLVQVGYHQRWVRRDRDGTMAKGWWFVPHRPKRPGCRFARALVEADRSVEPWPFVVGDVQRPRLVAILEGQWDALTWFGAFGWMEHDAAFEGGVCAFGIRGARGVRSFFAGWGEWLRAVRPVVWLIPDGDAAGRGWHEPIGKPRCVPEPSFAQLLGEAGAARVLVTVPASEGVKDFNDWWRERQPSVPWMWSWARRLGVADVMAGGGVPVC